MELIRVVDLETTGLPPDAEVVEVASADLIRDGEWRLANDWAWQQLCCPEHPIPPEASAVHHILDEDVVLCGPWGAAWPKLMIGATGAAPSALAAHNAAFERAFITDEMTGGAPWICTYKCALRQWPEAPAHNNQTLRYWLRPSGLDREHAALAHRALPDAYVTAFILRELLKHQPPETLIEWSSEPAMLVKVSFGKHRGMRWSEVDSGYLQWVLGQDFDENTLFTARHELRRRQEI